jgi:hypothetical protein
MSRKVTVLVESTQSKVVFESNATTLGELKNELRERQVRYDSNCVFKEAASKTILTSDESVLPSNIPWKGQVTNDLVFMVTAPQKKIRSGVMDRREAYARVKELGLQGKIQEHEGKNFTQCSTAVLISYIENEEKKAVKKTPKHTPAPIAKEKVVKADAYTMPASGKEMMSNLRNLLDEMVSKGVLMQHDADNIWGVANGQPALPVEREQSYDELAEQFDF